MIDHRVIATNGHLIIICRPEPQTVYISNKQIHWIFIWCICATELWMSQTPEGVGHRGIPAEASQSEGTKKERDNLLIVSVGLEAAHHLPTN